jgi:hypothetical protein
MATLFRYWIGMPSYHHTEHRQFLAQLVKILILVALLAFTWVIIASLSTPQHDTDENVTPVFEVDVSALKPGTLKKVPLRHREVWIYRRSTQDIEKLKKQKQPMRSLKDEYFVFFPYEPKRQCLVNWEESKRSFYDTCNARYFDLAGRTEVPVSPPVMLSIPDYRFASEQLIQIDAR